MILTKFFVSVRRKGRCLRRWLKNQELRSIFLSTFNKGEYGSYGYQIKNQPEKRIHVQNVHIPYNEEENITKLVEDWYPVVERYGNEKSRLVIVNDGSEDILLTDKFDYIIIYYT